MKFEEGRGFTLLELLIVVTIISILAMVAFDYLGGSREKGADGATKQNVVNARSQAEVYFTANEDYSGLCNDATAGIFLHIHAATEAQNIIPRAVYADNQAGTATQEACHDNVNGYAVWVPLKQNGGICIDSQNTTRVTATPLGANQFVCPL